MAVNENDLESLWEDIPVPLDPSTARTVQNTYTQGLLTGVGAGAITYGTISYYPNLLVSRVVHGHGVVETPPRLRQRQRHLEPGNGLSLSRPRQPLAEPERHPRPTPEWPHQAGWPALGAIPRLGGAAVSPPSPASSPPGVANSFRRAGRSLLGAVGQPPGTPGPLPGAMGRLAGANHSPHEMDSRPDDGGRPPAPCAEWKWNRAAQSRGWRGSGQDRRGRVGGRRRETVGRWPELCHLVSDSRSFSKAVEGKP